MSNLSQDLYTYLITHLQSVDHNLRLKGCWVMDHSWWNEVRRLADARTPVYQPQRPLAGPDLLFGIPIVVGHSWGLPKLAYLRDVPPGQWIPVRRY